MAMSALATPLLPARTAPVLAGRTVAVLAFFDFLQMPSALPSPPSQWRGGIFSVLHLPLWGGPSFFGWLRTFARGALRPPAIRGSLAGQALVFKATRSQNTGIGQASSQNQLGGSGGGIGFFLLLGTGFFLLWGIGFFLLVGIGFCLLLGIGFFLLVEPCDLVPSRQASEEGA